MNPELTPGAERALAAALSWAQRLGAADLEAPHLLLGLVDDEDAHPATLLCEQMVTVEAVRNALLNTLPFPSEHRQLPSEGAHDYALVRQLVHAARLLALDFGERTANSVHLMIALLEQDVDLRGLLSGLGFNVEKVREGLQDAQGPPLILDEPLELPETSAEHDAARILDANVNRACEGLRVMEDYCRFVLEDSFLSGAMKEVRHDLASAFSRLPAGLLLQSRDTEGDIGTAITTAGESSRHSLAAVVAANAKRATEALRCLEEYGKLYDPSFGQAMEQLRYRTYTLEKAVVASGDARARLAQTRLCLLIGRASSAAALEWTISEAVTGGVDLVQYREKGVNDREWLELARRARTVTRRLGVPLIVNDRCDLARIVDADGVHLGQDDLSVAHARRILGPHAMIGVSTHSISQVHAAIRAGASYIGVGPTFPSKTKEFTEFPGLDLARTVRETTSLPAFAIGGIDPNNVASVLAAGIHRIAVGQAISKSEDPRGLAKKLRAALDALPAA